VQNETERFAGVVKLGVDVGKKRIGVAKVEPNSTFAYDIDTVTLENDDRGVESITELVHENGAGLVYVGLPLSLSGENSELTNYVIDWAEELCEVVDAEIRLCDERFSSSVAHSKLFEAGRKSKKHRKVIDRCAAREILQNALDFEAQNGKLSGVKYDEACR
jgi:putative Holliday junction resolvase